MVARTPGTSWFVRRAALAPVEIKTPLFERTLSEIAWRAPMAARLVETNGGISNRLRLLLPAHKHNLLFGRPCHSEAERGTLALAKTLARRSRTFLDVGANEGLFTLAIAADAEAGACGAIHCFEPDPALFARLQENLRRNRIDACAVNAALGREAGMGTFYRNHSDENSGSLTTYFADQHEVAAIEVPVRTLGDYLADNDLRHVCAKIDVEGAGVAVWEGIGGACRRIDWLIMEMLDPEMKAGLPGRIMAETGWHAYYIRDFSLIRSLGGEFEYRAPFYNWLLCAASPATLREVLSGTRFRVVDPAAPTPT
jgi:FkbM family methyltransferase